MNRDYDVVVCGAGMVGAAVAYGLAGQGLRVLAVDGGDTDYRAAKANFGLVWVQGKGYGKPDYQRLSRQAAQAWPAFAGTLEAETGMALQYERRGGLNFCLGETQWNARAARLQQWHAQLPEHESCTEMLERGALEKLLPGVVLGSSVVGASFGHLDGHVNPLRLLAALQHGFVARGGVLQQGQRVERIEPVAGGGFRIEAGAQTYGGARIVIAAGLGSPALGAMVGLDVPLRPQRGQVLVTERLAPLLPYPASGVRQTGEGTVMIGVTQEEVGYDLRTTTAAAAHMSRQALLVLPALAQARWIRQWSCLRIMTPDGCPVYAESATHPGAHIALCHSGVTLASFHAGAYVQALDGARLPAELDFFHPGRFDVSQAA
jgi:glycine/D-amino acid oxidase-like deaminating enzyme